MGKKLLFTTIVSLVCFSIFGQSKKELEATVDTLNSTVQTLQTERASLMEQVADLDTQLVQMEILQDSLAGQLQPYQDFYFYMRDNFFPDKAANMQLEEVIELVDSLRAVGDTSRLNMQNTALLLADSLMELKQRVDSMAFENNAFRQILGLMLDQALYPLSAEDLKGEWSVFLQPTNITGDEDYTGIVSRNQVVLADSLFDGMLKSIVFLEDELADLYFMGGKKTKCFFKVNDFNRSDTYTIDLNKGAEIDIRLFVTHVPRGLQISYEIPGKQDGRNFYFGYMRRQ